MAGHPDRRIIRSRSSKWRRVIWSGRVVTGEVYKRRAISWVEALYGLTLSDDVAEAICMGHAVLGSKELWDLLPMKARRAQKARAS